MLKPNSPVTANLIRARELIADEKNWCVGKLQIEDKQFCAMGAMNFVTSNNSWDFQESKKERLLLASAALEAGYSSPPALNNEAGHAAVMRMFDRAIELSLTE